MDLLLYKQIKDKILNFRLKSFESTSSIMRYVVEALFLRELKTRFGKNRRLGYFWVVGEPMTHILFFLVIFTLIRARTIPQVPIEMFLVTGFVPFFMFRNIVTQIMAGVQANRALIAYKPVKPIHIFIARTLLEMCIYFAVFVLFMAGFGWFLDLPILPVHFLEVFIAFLGLAFLGFALGVCLAFLNTELEYAQIFINYGINILYFGSAVLYPLWIMPDYIIEILLYNPVLQFLEILRENYFDGYPQIDGINFTYPLSFGIILLFIGLWYYYFRYKYLGQIR